MNIKNILRKITYSKIVAKILFIFLSIFYDKKFLKGKFFEEKRIGFIWAIKISLLEKGKELHGHTVQK